MKKTTFFFAFYLLFLAGARAQGASARCSFSFLHEGQEIQGDFMARFEKIQGTPSQVNLVFSNLSIEAPEDLKSKLRLLAVNEALDIRNGKTDPFRKRFGKGLNAEVPIFIDNPAQPVAVAINSFHFLVKKGDDDDSFLKSGSICSVSYKAKTEAAEPSQNPPPGDNTTAVSEKPDKPAPRPQNPATPSPKPDKETLAFQRAMGFSDPEARSSALISFLEKYPASSFAAEAKKYIRTEKDGKPSGNVIQFLLKYSIAPTLSADTTKIEIVTPLTPSEGGHLVAFRLKPGFDKEQVLLYDAAKTPAFQADTLFLERDMRALDVALTPVDGAKYQLTLSGGKPDFWIYFFDENGKVDKLSRPVNQTNTSIVLDTRQLRDIWGAWGELTVKVVQRKENNTKTVGKIIIPEPQPLWPYIAGGLGIVVLGYFISQYRAMRRKKAVEEKLKKREEKGETAITTEEMAAGVVSETALAPDVALPPVPPPASNFKIRSMTPAREKDKKTLDETEFEEVLRNGVYHKLELTQNWADTALAELHVSKKSIQAIDRFLRNQRNQHIEEQEGSIPEIGGFLLGKYCFVEKTQRFKVALEEFVPIVPEEHDTYQLQFSTESLVNELGEAQDQYPDLALVGWFHTHPGHGLFLSKPDMTIHDGFFRERYQFAMEIDTLTENLITGFFTRTTSGGANNLDTVLPGSKWFEWTEIEKVTRRK